MPGKRARACTDAGRAHNPPLLLLHHACSCIPAAAGVLSSQAPAPNPLHKEKTARTIAPFFPFLLYTNIYRVLYTSLQTVPLGTHSSLRAEPPLPQGQPQPVAVPRDRSIPAPCWTRAGECRWVQEQGTGSTSPLPQPGSSHVISVSSLREWVTLTMPLCTHTRSSSSQAQELRGLPSPCTEDPHLFPSVPLSSRPRIPTERCAGKSATSSQSTNPPPPALCVWLPSSEGRRGEKPWMGPPCPIAEQQQG